MVVEREPNAAATGREFDRAVAVFHVVDRLEPLTVFTLVNGQRVAIAPGRLGPVTETMTRITARGAQQAEAG
jgi:hypothetical protein